MKAVCNKCKFQVSGEKRAVLDENFRGHSMTYGHNGYTIIDYE
jgi:hypothetical protein